MEKTKKVTEEPHSVKFAINQKGKFSAEVKAYGANIKEALGRAVELAGAAEAIVRDKNKEVK